MCLECVTDMSVLYRGKVTNITADGVFVEVPSWAPGMEFGPCDVPDYVFVVGEQVLVGQVGDVSEDLVVVAPLMKEFIEGGGGDGGTAGTYTYVQTEAASTWIIDHNLNKYPSVVVLVGGEHVYTDVSYATLNTLTLMFPSPVTGTAHLV